MNPILQQTQKVVFNQLEPKEKARAERVIAAGKRKMFDKKTHFNMELVKNPNAKNTPVETVSAGIAGLMYLMYQESEPKISMHVMGIAGTILMCEAFDFGERALGMKITNDIVAETTRAMMSLFLHKLGIKPQQLEERIQQGRQEILDYTASEKAAKQAPKGLLSGQA